MTAKSFFKSTAFKCIVTLLCVLLVSGIFLTVMNALLQVTDQEKFDRAINKIYGKSVKTETVTVANYNDNGNIDEAYRVKDDGNYLIKATGYGGFDNGSVTCWIVVVVKNGAVGGIDKVIIDSNKSQSYIANINDKFLSGFKTNFNGEHYSPYEGFIMTGATRSATAICNAVNAALDFVNAKFGNVTEDPYKDFKYAAKTETSQTTIEYNAEAGEIEVDGETIAYTAGSVSFTVVSKGYGMASNFTSFIVVNAEGYIETYKVLKAGSTDDSYTDKALKNLESMFLGKNEEGLLKLFSGSIEYPGDGKFITSGASHSSYCLYTSALFATGNYLELVPDEEGGDNGGEANE